jgi:hypothetical protein
LVQRGITLDRYKDMLLSSNAFLTPVVKNIGGSIFMFREEDFKDEATIKAQLRTWLPLPYMKLFRDYCELLYALHKEPMSDKDQETINKTVDSFIKFKAVPVKYQTFIEYMVKCGLRDGYKFNLEEDDIQMRIRMRMTSQKKLQKTTKLLCCYGVLLVAIQEAIQAAIQAAIL